MKKTILMLSLLCLGLFSCHLIAQSKSATSELRDRTFKCMIASRPYDYMFDNMLKEADNTVELFGIPFGMYTGGTQGALFYSGFMQCLHDFNSTAGSSRLPWGSYQPIEKQSGIKALLRETPFASVNPRVLAWGVSQFLPEPQEKLDGVSYQKIYTVVLQRSARLMTESYLFIRYKSDFQKEQALYMQTAMQAKFADMDSHLSSRYDGVLSEYRLGTRDWGILEPHHAIGFWLRRGLDKSHDSLWQHHAAAMQKYDADWFGQVIRKYPVTID